MSCGMVKLQTYHTSKPSEVSATFSIQRTSWVRLMQNQRKNTHDDDEIVEIVRHSRPEPNEEVKKQAEAQKESHDTNEVVKEPQDVDDHIHGRTHDDLPKTRKTSKEHLMEQIIDSLSKGVTIRSSIINLCLHTVFGSH